MTEMKPEDIRPHFERLGASYRALPTDELLGELQHLQQWITGFLGDCSRRGELELGRQGLSIVVPFYFLAMEALYPKLEVLYGVHAKTPDDEGATRKQLTQLLELALTRKKGTVT